MRRGTAPLLNNLLECYQPSVREEIWFLGKVIAVATDRGRPAFDSRRDVLIEQLSDGSVKSSGWPKVLIRSQEFFEKGAVLKMRIHDEDVTDFSISNLSELVHDMSWADFKGAVENGKVGYILTPEENSNIFKQLLNGKNKVALYVEGRPTLKIDARIYRCSRDSTGHTRRCFNGALDIIVVEDKDGSFKNSGLFLSLSNSSECLRTAERTDVTIKINCDPPDFTMELNRLRQKTRRGTPTEQLTPPENKQIFKRLQEGRNNITFSIGGGHPDSEIRAHIYNWKPNTKVVIVDIDGTLTKSNFMGMWKNFMGEEYFQPGIRELLWYIKLQGYEILYLTARPVSTIRATRELLADNLEEENFR